jgi:hypothetical protein
MVSGLRLDVAPLSPISRGEFLGYPLAGNYELELDPKYTADLTRVENIEIAFDALYWQPLNQWEEVAPQAVSIPKGEGTIEGLGESFSTNLPTGTFEYTVPLRTPPARGGAQPNLSLTYSSAGGAGIPRPPSSPRPAHTAFGSWRRGRAYESALPTERSRLRSVRRS